MPSAVVQALVEVRETSLQVIEAVMRRESYISLLFATTALCNCYSCILRDSDVFDSPHLKRDV